MTNMAHGSSNLIIIIISHQSSAMSALSSSMYVSQLLFSYRQGGVGVELGSTAEQVCSLLEALLAHQASTQPLTQATGSLHAQARPALHVEASPSCILLLLYNSVLATLLNLSLNQQISLLCKCFLCQRAMLARHGQMLVISKLAVEQLTLELVSYVPSCLRHSIQPFSHSSMLCVRCSSGCRSVTVFVQSNDDFCPSNVSIVVQGP